MTNPETPIIHEDFSPLLENVPQEFIDRFRDATRLSRYLNKLKDNNGFTVDAMSKQSYTPKDTVKNLLSAKSKNPRLDTIAPVIYYSGGSFDELFYPEGYESRVEASTKALKEMYESQAASQQESFDNQLNDLKTIHEKTILGLNEVHKQEIADLNEIHKQEIVELNIRHKQEIADLGIYHNEKSEAERKSNDKILDIAVFDKRWFRILSCILASSVCVLLIMLAMVTSRLISVMATI